MFVLIVLNNMADYKDDVTLSQLYDTVTKELRDLFSDIDNETITQIAKKYDVLMPNFNLNFDIGFEEIEKENEQPVRFTSITGCDIKHLQETVKSKNTCKNTNWGISISSSSELSSIPKTKVFNYLKIIYWMRHNWIIFNLAS